VRRILLTGLSGVGKSTVSEALAARGFRAIDLDSDEWSEWRRSDDGVGVRGNLDWVWREDRVRRLLASEDDEVLFISGSASNQAQFYPRLDGIVLLSAPAEVMAERLATRTNNPYGKQPDELERALQLKSSIEPMLRTSAHLEIDTSAPLEDVVQAVIAYSQGDLP
jgi:shikimate kinase